MITVAEGVMTSDVTAHTAGRGANHWWQVTWLPGRDLTLYDANAALVLAEDVVQGLGEPWRKHRVQDMADVLRVSPGAAVAACVQTPAPR